MYDLDLFTEYRCIVDSLQMDQATELVSQSSRKERNTSHTIFGAGLTMIRCKDRFFESNQVA